MEEVEEEVVVEVELGVVEVEVVEMEVWRR